MTVLNDYVGRYDIEQYLDDLEKIFKDNFNSEIAIIDAEKSDFTLLPIDDNAWFMNEIPQTFDYDPFVVWGIETLNTPSKAGVATLQSVSVSFEVAKQDDANLDTQAVIRHLLRYSRALKSVVHKNHRTLRGIAKLEINALLPAPSILRGNAVFSAGVSLTATFDA